MIGDPPIQRPDTWSFTVAVLSDTQRYAERNPAAFEIQTCWFAEQWADGDAFFVVHVGDVVDAPERETEAGCPSERFDGGRNDVTRVRIRPR